jgi:GNAT superfamily N-acetyltransferase
VNLILRPIRPDDAAGLVALHARLSAHTRYLRFFTPSPHLPPALLHRFVNVDHHSREAFVSLSGTRIVAVGRYERLSPSEAEVALVVEDAFQGRGVGRALLAHLALAARTNGIERFVGTVLPENTGVMRWTSGYPVERRFADGLISLGFPLGGPRPQREQLGVRADLDDPAAQGLEQPVLVAAQGRPDGPRGLNDKL